MKYRVFYPADQVHPGGDYYVDEIEGKEKALEFAKDTNGIVFSGRSRGRR